MATLIEEAPSEAAMTTSAGYTSEKFEVNTTRSPKPGRRTERGRYGAPLEVVAIIVVLLCAHLLTKHGALLFLEIPAVD